MLQQLHQTMNKSREDPQASSKMKSHKKYTWEGINYPSENNDQKKFEKYNFTIALNDFYAKREKIYPAYISKHNLNRK